MVALSILIVSEQPAHFAAIEQALWASAARILRVSGAESARQAIAQGRWDCVVLSSLETLATLQDGALSPAMVYVAEDSERAHAAAVAGALASVPAAQLSPASIEEAVRLACARKLAQRRQIQAASQDTVALVRAAAERLAVPLAWSARLVAELPGAAPRHHKRLVAELQERLEQGRASLAGLLQIGSLEAREISAVDLSELAEQAYRRVRWPVGTVIQRSLSPLPPVHADARQLMVAIRSLLDNAADALSEQPEDARQLWLDASSQSNAVSISIADSGPGISPLLRRRVCAPLFSTRDDHLGVGLWLVESIAARHGGQLSLSDREGGGTCAILTVPRATMLGEGEPVLRAAAEARPVLTTLVLSQELTLSDTLRALPGRVEVTTVRSAHEALHALRTHPRYGLVVCDAMSAEEAHPGLLAQLSRAQSDQIFFVFEQQPTAEVARRIHASMNRILPWPMTADAVASISLLQEG